MSEEQKSKWEINEHLLLEVSRKPIPYATSFAIRNMVSEETH